MIDTPAIVSKKSIGVQTSDLNEPKKTTGTKWGSFKSFVSKTAESLKSTILDKKDLISKAKKAVDSKLESLKTKGSV